MEWSEEKNPHILFYFIALRASFGAAQLIKVPTRSSLEAESWQIK